MLQQDKKTGKSTRTSPGISLYGSGAQTVSKDAMANSQVTAGCPAALGATIFPPVHPPAQFCPCFAPECPMPPHGKTIAKSLQGSSNQNRGPVPALQVSTQAASPPWWLWSAVMPWELQLSPGQHTKQAWHWDRVGSGGKSKEQKHSITPSPSTASAFSCVPPLWPC